jgi:Zn-dependent protease
MSSGRGLREVKMGDVDVTYLISNLVIYMVVLLLAISAHEAGHAWMSYKFGDDTAYLLGRVTLNPVKHTDPVGTLLIPIISFIFGALGGALGAIPLIGWGIPTPVNPRKWRNYRTANVMVSIAGIGANLILAIIGFVILKSLLEFHVLQGADEGIVKPILMLLQYMIFLNISLAVFNLLPFPPLDGSKVLSTFLPDSFQPVFALLEQYGFLILMLLIYWGVVGVVMQPVFWFVRYLLLTPWF